MPSRRHLPGAHVIIRDDATGNWITDDDRFSIESDDLETTCEGTMSRSGYCPAHGYDCDGVAFYTAWTVWDRTRGDHIDGNPFPYYTFTEALNRLKGEYSA